MTLQNIVGDSDGVAFGGFTDRIRLGIRMARGVIRLAVTHLSADERLILAGRQRTRGESVAQFAWSLLRGFFDALRGRQVAADAAGDTRGGILDGIPGKVGVPGGRLHLRVTQQFPDHGQAFAQGQRPGSIRMAEVVNSPLFQSGAPTDAAPRMLKADRY